MFIGWALWWYIPRRRLYSCTAGSGPSRVQRTAACGGLPLTACPGCATSSGAAGAYILQSRPLSLDRERAGGGIGLTVGRMCGKLGIEKPLVSRDYGYGTWVGGIKSFTCSFLQNAFNIAKEEPPKSNVKIRGFSLCFTL